MLELRAAKLVKVPGSTMHCAPGHIGECHTGLVIDAIHFNIRLMQNYMFLERSDIRDVLLANSHRNRICACGVCGMFTHEEDPAWMDWKKSSKALYYHPRCYSRIVACGSWWF